MGPEEAAIYGEDAAATGGNADADGPAAKRQRLDGSNVQDDAHVGHQQSLTCQVASVCCCCVLNLPAAAPGLTHWLVPAGP